MTTTEKPTTESMIANAIAWDGVQVRHLHDHEYEVRLPLAEAKLFAASVGVVWEAGFRVKSAKAVGTWPGLYAEIYIEVQS
jgi:hypothetical protein